VEEIYRVFSCFTASGLKIDLRPVETMLLKTETAKLVRLQLACNSELCVICIHHMLS